MTSVLTINEELFIGSGGHQATYIHPIDPTKCIKIAHMKDDGDVKKEMRYRRMCAAKLEKSQLVTEFFGTVETNLGLGYVFERVLDYDGKTSRDMKNFLPATQRFDSNNALPSKPPRIQTNRPAELKRACRCCRRFARDKFRARVPAP